MGPSEKQLNESGNIGGVHGSTSGRIMGRYFSNEKEEEQVLRENVHEVCFWLNAEAMFEHPTCAHEFTKNAVTRFVGPNGGIVRVRQRKKPFKGSLLLQSCVITGFYNQVRAGCNASIEVNTSYF